MKRKTVKSKKNSIKVNAVQVDTVIKISIPPVEMSGVGGTQLLGVVIAESAS